MTVGNHMQTDITYDDMCAYGSDKWCAAKLGKTLNWFRDHRAKLETDGFPKADLLIGHTLKADVEEFLGNRRKIKNAVGEPQTQGENLDAL